MSECIDHGRVGYGLGYASAWVTLPDKVRRCTTLHRKVYYEATGELPEVVRHTCDNPRCVNLDHLIGGTQVDNMLDMLQRGRQGDCRNFGADNGRTKLTPSDVDYIRTYYVKGSKEFGLPALARLFGCGTSQVHRIVKGVAREAVTENT